MCKVVVMGSARLRRVALIGVLLLAGGSASSAPAHAANPTPPAPSLPANYPLLHPNTDIAHFSQLANRTAQLQLYNGPVSLPSRTGWRLRDTSLQLTSTGVLSPTALPFTLKVPATFTPGAALASLVNEDGVSLQVTPAAGLGLASVTGRASGATVTYPSLAAQTDASVRATISGIDLHVVLHGAATNTFTFTLAAGQGSQLVQEGNAIVVKRPIQQCGSTGCVTTQQPEYVLEPPILRDSRGGSAAAALVGPVGVSLDAAASSVTLSLNSAWLRDSHRVFPVQLDVPIVTAVSAFHSGLFGTLNSCAPDVAAPLTHVVVGAAGGCTYHGFAYFDVSTLLPGTTIQSATLNLYTPTAIGATGVSVFADSPPTTSSGPITPPPSNGGPIPPPPSGSVTVSPPLWQPLAWQPPSWATAPKVLTGTTALAEQPTSASSHWHSWDVTKLVQQWVNDRRDTNGGLTLIGSGAPVVFASPLGEGADSVATAPYLNITYQPPSPVPSRFASTGNATSGSATVTPIRINLSRNRWSERHTIWQCLPASAPCCAPHAIWRDQRELRRRHVPVSSTPANAPQPAASSGTSPSRG